MPQVNGINYDSSGNPASFGDSILDWGNSMLSGIFPQWGQNTAGDQINALSQGTPGQDAAYQALMAQLTATGRGQNPSLASFSPYDAAARGKNPTLGANVQPDVKYNMGMANQNRGQIQDALAMISNQVNNPANSAVGAQAGLAQSANARAALNAMAGAGRGGGQVAAQSLTNTGQMAGDIANARMNEYLRGQAGLGAGYGNLRGSDIQNFQNQSKIGQANAQLVDQRQLAANMMAARLNQARTEALLNKYKLYRQLGQANQNKGIQAVKGYTGFLGTIASAAGGG